MADFILDPGEVVIERIGRYWADLIGVVLSSTAIIIAALTLIYLGTVLNGQVPLLTPQTALWLAVIMIGVAILMLASAAYVFHHNYILITNVHIIKVQQVGLFARQTAELGLGNIEDVKGGRAGVLHTILNYGDIEIQTAGTSENFIFRTVHNPQLVADRLLQYKEEFRHRHPDEAHAI